MDVVIFSIYAVVKPNWTPIETMRVRQTAIVAQDETNIHPSNSCCESNPDPIYGSLAQYHFVRSEISDIF